MTPSTAAIVSLVASLQQKMKDENRRFSLLSNVMKTKLDSARNAIQNVR